MIRTSRERRRIWRRGAGLALGVLLIVGCASPIGGADEEAAVVAVVDGVAITEEELREATHGEILRLRVEHERAVYRNRKSVLQYLVDSQLIRAEADRRGGTPSDLMEAEVRVPARKVPEEEVRALYEEYADRLEEPYDAVRGRLREHLAEQRYQARRTEFLRELRTVAEVEMRLPYPELPSVDVPERPGAPERGPAGASVTIVEFADFQCPYCRRMQDTLDALLESYDGRIRHVYRHFPLESHPMAEPAALASACAAEQERFWAFHDRVFERQAELSDESLDEIAQEVGLEMAAYRSCREERRYADRVQADLQAGRQAGVRGTPAFFVNGQPILGAASEDAFRELIERALGEERG